MSVKSAWTIALATAVALSWSHIGSDCIRISGQSTMKNYRKYDSDTLADVLEWIDRTRTPIRLEDESLAHSSLNDSATAFLVGNQSSPCAGHKWILTDKMVGKGSNGDVLEVVRDPFRWHDPVLALKVAKRRLSDKQQLIVYQEIRKEITVMQDMARIGCGATMSVVDASPCLAPYSTPLLAAYVSTRMRGGDLLDWLKGEDNAGRQNGQRPSAQQVRQCAASVYEETKAALTCLHHGGQGYMHGDLKPSNVYYSDMDVNGCPINLKLADFGLTYRLKNSRGERKLVKKFSSIHFDECGNIPGICFKDSPAFPVGLEIDHDYYHAAEEVDECSLAWMMQVLFGFNVSSHLRPGTNCGLMGIHRGQAISGPAILNESRVELVIPGLDPNLGAGPMSQIGDEAATLPLGADTGSRLDTWLGKRERSVDEFDLQSHAAIPVTPATRVTGATVTVATAAASEVAAASAAGVAADTAQTESRKRVRAMRDPEQEIHGAPAMSVMVEQGRIPQGRVVDQYEELL